MQGRAVSSYSVLRGYVLREFLLSLVVAFLFFFFIFFINQLLLFAQRILLKNVDVRSVLRLVGLSVPQILLYTIPFSTLSASAMTIGDLSARNEILALRASGVPLRKLFEPIAIMGLILAFATFLVADVLLPYSNQRYRTLYAELLRDLPTIELESYSVNRVGDIVLVTGEVVDDHVDSLVLFDVSNRFDSQVISASGGTVTLVDIDSFLYRLDLEEPVVLVTDSHVAGNYSLANARSVTYYLDFSDQVSRFTDVTPSQLSSRDLIDAIEARKTDFERDSTIKKNRLNALLSRQADVMRKLDSEPFPADAIEEIVSLEREIRQVVSQRDINFYLQYYQAELHKKAALSVSCFILVFITFPIAFVTLKHGRLFGFGLSLLVACAYWFLLFFAQTKILEIAVNPGFLMWAPNALVCIVAAILLFRKRRV